MPLGQALVVEGTIPGIKIETGAKPLAGSPDETVTEEGCVGKYTQDMEHEVGGYLTIRRTVMTGATTNSRNDRSNYHSNTPRHFDDAETGDKNSQRSVEQ